jgi:hypothetical protein
MRFFLVVNCAIIPKPSPPESTTSSLSSDFSRFWIFFGAALGEKILRTARIAEPFSVSAPNVSGSSLDFGGDRPKLIATLEERSESLLKELPGFRGKDLCRLRDFVRRLASSPELV